MELYACEPDAELYEVFDKKTNKPIRRVTWADDDIGEYRTFILNADGSVKLNKKQEPITRLHKKPITIKQVRKIVKKSLPKKSIWQKLMKQIKVVDGGGHIIKMKKLFYHLFFPRIKIKFRVNFYSYFNEEMEYPEEYIEDIKE